MRNSPILHGVLLDVGGVLVVPQPAELARVIVAYGGVGDEADLIHGHYQALALADGWQGFDWPAYDRELLIACGVPPEMRAECAAAIANAVATVPDWWSHPLEGVRWALQVLADLVPTGIVSNSDGTVERLLRDLQLAQVGPGRGANITVIVDSAVAVAGVAKPSPEIFEPAVAALGLPVESICYVGDTVAFDVYGARSAGLYPIHMDPYELCGDRVDHDHIRKLGDLASMLTRLRA